MKPSQIGLQLVYHSCWMVNESSFAALTPSVWLVWYPHSISIFGALKSPNPTFTHMFTKINDPRTQDIHWYPLNPTCFSCFSCFCCSKTPQISPKTTVHLIADIDEIFCPETIYHIRKKNPQNLFSDVFSHLFYTFSVFSHPSIWVNHTKSLTWILRP